MFLKEGGTILLVSIQDLRSIQERCEIGELVQRLDVSIDRLTVIWDTDTGSLRRIFKNLKQAISTRVDSFEIHDNVRDDVFTLAKDFNEYDSINIIFFQLSTYGGEQLIRIDFNPNTLKEFDDMVKKLRDRNINVVVHIINGLPYETEEMMLDTVKHLNNLDIQGIKIHMLNICKDTPIETLYNKEHFHILTKEEYIDIVIKQLELLREEIVIHRITSDPDKDSLIEPTWLLKKFCLLNDIDKEMKKRDTYQGKYTK